MRRVAVMNYMPSREVAGRSLLFDQNPRGVVKHAFEPHEAYWYKACSGAERPNTLLKDCYGLRQVWGHCKVHAHCNVCRAGHECGAVDALHSVSTIRIKGNTKCSV